MPDFYRKYRRVIVTEAYQKLFWNDGFVFPSGVQKF
jgi:hypothetical protein